MKIQFDTPTTGKDPSGNEVPLTAAQVASLTYTALIDTVNPPVKSYTIPAAVVAAGVQVGNSKHITVDAEADLGITIVPNTQYFIELYDSMGGAVSADTAELTFTEAGAVVADPPQNPSVG